MTPNEFYEEIVLSLGGGLVDVELGEKELELCFKKAKRTFIQKGNNSYRRDFIRIKVNKCSMVYQLPRDINAVVRVIKPTMTFHINDEFSLAAYNELFGHKSTSAMGDYLSYELTLQMIETWRRYLAFDVQHHFNEFTQEISFLKAPEKDGFWLLEVYRNLSDDQYRDVLWVQSWALAEAKIILGTAYRKFSGGLPSPDGSSASLDGNSLIQDGMQDKERLLEDINNGIDGSYGSAWEISFC